MRHGTMKGMPYKNTLPDREGEVGPLLLVFALEIESARDMHCFLTLSWKGGRLTGYHVATATCRPGCASRRKLCCI